MYFSGVSDMSYLQEMLYFAIAGDAVFLVSLWAGGSSCSVEIPAARRADRPQQTAAAGTLLLAERRLVELPRQPW